MDETKYTLVEHLEELRKRLIYCLIFFGFSSALAWQLVPHVIKYASAPVGKLVFIHPTEAFFTYFKVALWSGFFLSLPVILYNVWKFVALGLNEAEKKTMVFFAPASFLLFLLGASFAFFLAIPLSVKFLVGFGRGWAEPMLSIGEYISFVGWLLLAFGATFELPLVIFFLAKLKVLTQSTLRTYRKHAVLLIFIAAAVLTPTPDVFTQLLLAVPLIILYELSIILSRWA
jgi:sec-independent protein translocase protein TatC